MLHTEPINEIVNQAITYQVQQYSRRMLRKWIGERKKAEKQGAEYWEE